MAMLSLVGLRLVVTFVCLSAFITGSMWKTDAATSYDGDEVIEAIVDGDEKLNNFSSIVNRLQLNLWKPPVAVTGWKSIVHVTSADKLRVKEELRRAGIAYRTVIKNLQTQIDRERESNPVEGVALPWMSKRGRWNSRRKSRGRRSSTPHSIVGKYATYEEIHDWMTDTSLAFPNVTSLEVIGKTFEGRDLLLLKIGDKRSTTKKPGIWLDGGTHAREWITVSSAIYIISQILTDYYNGTGVGHEEKEEMTLIESVDWYIVPIINPDGYAYTHNINGSRLWRKNRSFYANYSFSAAYNRTCLGTDINRNFDFSWNYYGTLNESCYETYCGPRPASENETRAIKNYFFTHNSSIHGYVTIHSFGQLFMVRWAYSANASKTPEFNYTLSVANEAVEAINRTSGFIYLTGTSPEVLYAFSGGSGDWVRANTPIRHVYDVELRDQGEFGFILPAENILPVGQEIWEAIKVVATHVLEDNPPTTDEDNPPTTDEDNPPTTDQPPTKVDHDWDRGTTIDIIYTMGTTGRREEEDHGPRNGQVKTLPRLLLFLGPLVLVFRRWV